MNNNPRLWSSVVRELPINLKVMGSRFAKVTCEIYCEISCKMCEKIYFKKKKNVNNKRQRVTAFNQGFTLNGKKLTKIKH